MTGPTAQDYLSGEVLPSGCSGTLRYESNDVDLRLNAEITASTSARTADLRGKPAL